MSAQRKRLDEETVTAIAVQLTLAILSCVPRGTIDPKRWWTRAKSALLTAAERSYSWPEMVSGMCDSLQVPVTHKRAASCLSLISRAVNEDESAFEQFRRFCEQNAVFVIAMAQEERARQKEEKKLSHKMRATLGLTDDEAKAWGEAESEEIPF